MQVECYHYESHGSGKHGRRVRVTTDVATRVMQITGWKDRSDGINVSRFSSYKLIKVTVLRSWYSSDEDGIDSQRNQFLAEYEGRDQHIDYSEQFNLGDTPVKRLLANGQPSLFARLALTHTGYIVAVLLLNAWLWRFYFECVSSRTILKVRKEVNNQFYGFAKDPVAATDGSRTPVGLGDAVQEPRDDELPAYEDVT